MTKERKRERNKKREKSTGREGGKLEVRNMNEEHEEFKAKEEVRGMNEQHVK